MLVVLSHQFYFISFLKCGKSLVWARRTSESISEITLTTSRLLISIFKVTDLFRLVSFVNPTHKKNRCVLVKMNLHLLFETTAAVSARFCSLHNVLVSAELLDCCVLCSLTFLQEVVFVDQFLGLCLRLETCPRISVRRPRGLLLFLLLFSLSYNFWRTIAHGSLLSSEFVLILLDFKESYHLKL